MTSFASDIVSGALFLYHHWRRTNVQPPNRVVSYDEMMKNHETTGFAASFFKQKNMFSSY